MTNSSSIDNKIEPDRKMSIEDFKDKGVLQEVNRMFFHPRGIHLRIEKGKLVPYDYTDDPDGILYRQELSPEAEKYCEELLNAKSRPRLDKFQFVVQPIDFESLPGHIYKKYFYTNSVTAVDPEDR